MFYKNFPRIPYKINPLVTGQKSVVDILKSTKIVDFLQDRSNKLYVDYIVQDTEKPEHLAYRVYGRADYHWIILLANSIINPYFDWPMSSDEVEKQVSSLYSGLAIFFDPFNNVRFKIKDTSTYLTEAESNFVVGNKVYQVTTNSGTISGTIKEWDSTYRKLVITDISSSGGVLFNKSLNVYSTNKDGITFETESIPLNFSISQRVVEDNTYAVHHFVDAYGNFLDPYGNIDASALESDGLIYAKSNIFNTTLTSKNTPLNRYVSDLSNEFDAYVVTNRQYETDINDAKRKVKILKKEYVDTLVQQLNKIF